MLFYQSANIVGRGIPWLRPIDPPILHFDHNYGVRFIARQSYNCFLPTIAFQKPKTAVANEDISCIIICSDEISGAMKGKAQIGARLKRRTVLLTVPRLALIDFVVNILSAEIWQKQDASAQEWITVIVANTSGGEFSCCTIVSTHGSGNPV